MKPIEDVSRQRLAVIRQYILRDILIWTIQAPHRLVWFKEWWNTFYWLVYRREQKHLDGMKHCIRCEKLGRECWHPVEEFYKDTRDNHGLSVYCINCSNELNNAVRERDPEAARERRREWGKMHPEKISEYSRRAYAKNPESSIRATRKWQRENAERWNAYNRDWRAKKKEAQG